MTNIYEILCNWLNQNEGVLAAITFVLGLSISELISWMRRHKDQKIRIDKNKEVEHCLKIKKDINANIRWINQEGYGPILIRNVHKTINYKREIMDRGISPYFKLGFCGQYENGVLVNLGVFHVSFIKEIESKDNWYFCDYDDPNAKHVFLIGKIPYKWIYRIDWDGDGYYPFPHFYCLFESNNGEPYEELTYCEKIDRQEGDYYFREIVNCYAVKNKLN